MSEYKSVGMVETVEDGSVITSRGESIGTLFFEDMPDRGDKVFYRNRDDRQGFDIVTTSPCETCSTEVIPADDCFICPHCNRTYEVPESEEQKHRERIREEHLSGDDGIFSFIKKLFGFA